MKRARTITTQERSVRRHPAEVDRLNSLPLQLQGRLRVNPLSGFECVKTDDKRKYFTNFVKLSTGSSGSVFSADVKPAGRTLDPTLPPKVAIKEIQVDQERMVPLLLNEIALLKAIRTPHTIAYYGCYIKTDTLYLVMELVEGEDLFNRFMTIALTPVQKLWIAREIAIGITEIHAQGVAHRDIKLENVMISDTGGLKIIDFGLSCGKKDMSTHACRTLTIGTPGYIDPKLKDNRLASLQASDWWAYGQMMAILFTEKPLWAPDAGYTQFDPTDFQPVMEELHRDPSIPLNELPKILEDLEWVKKILLNLTDPGREQRARPGQVEIMAALNI